MDLKKMKELTDLYGYIVKPEKSSNKIILHKIFNNNFVEFSLYALVWNIKNYKGYKRYKSNVNIKYNEIKLFNNSKIKKQLLEDIFSQVIKNNILML